MNESLTFNELVNMGEFLLNNHTFENGLSLISNHLTSYTGADRCSIFIYEEEHNELWTILSTGIEKIHISSEKGIVGYIFRTKESIIENNVHQNSYFLNDIDMQSGYHTKNIIACPIYAANKKIIGVLELLNKVDGFTEKDLDFINIFANYLGSLIELAPFYLKN
jgi:GAF domain-containing protein